MTTKEIIKLANDVKNLYKHKSVLDIIKSLNYDLIDTNLNEKVYPAYIINYNGKPCIVLNKHFNQKQRNIIAAHELGHALLHEQCINHFAVTSSNIMTNIEFEANLFAIALLAEDDINMKLSIPLEKMNNYLLRTIMDYNIN